MRHIHSSERAIVVSLLSHHKYDFLRFKIWKSNIKTDFVQSRSGDYVYMGYFNMIMIIRMCNCYAKPIYHRKCMVFSFQANAVDLETYYAEFTSSFFIDMENSLELVHGFVSMSDVLFLLNLLYYFETQTFITHIDLNNMAQITGC